MFEKEAHVWILESVFAVALIVLILEGKQKKKEAREKARSMARERWKVISGIRCPQDLKLHLSTLASGQEENVVFPLSHEGIGELVNPKKGSLELISFLFVPEGTAGGSKTNPIAYLIPRRAAR